MSKIRSALIAALAAAILTGCSYLGEGALDVPVAEDAASGTDLKEQDNTAKEPKRDKNPETTKIFLDPGWDWAGNSEIDKGCAVLYKAASGRKDVVIAVNAGHGTDGGELVKTYCHPDRSPKITGGTNPAGSLKATAISVGMIFNDGTYEEEATLRCSRILRDKLLKQGYDVLMLRDEEDVQLDNVARTVIADNSADILVSIHWDSDGLDYDKGCFYVPVPDEIKEMEPVASNWREHEKLGEALITGLRTKGCKIYEGYVLPQELTQTCYSTIPSALVELGNATSAHDDAALGRLADGLLEGIAKYLN